MFTEDQLEDMTMQLLSNLGYNCKTVMKLKEIIIVFLVILI